MKYLVIELQTDAENHVANIVTAYDKENDAKAQYHQILAAAAVSSVVQHTAVLLTNTGNFKGSECFTHPIPEPTTEPEAEGGAE